MQKNEIEKSLFFNEISVEYKAAKQLRDYMERENSRICPAKPPYPTLSFIILFP